MIRLRRRYRQWAGSPHGIPEDLNNCAAQVADGGRSPLSHQCRKKRGHGPDGLLCTMHVRRLETGHHVHLPEPETSEEAIIRLTDLAAGWERGSDGEKVRKINLMIKDLRSKEST